MKMQRIKNLLGFAQKSGNLISGDNTCRAKIKKCKLIILAENCSEDNFKYYSYQCAKQDIPILQILSKDEIGMAIGKSPRTVVGIIDANFAKQIIQIIAGEGKE
ncbi:ribosomal L7Ae/L30e/S12e/Gadd45 family protein [Bacillota bacterium LX-D]|nr:ribosomal L7Ae/L30e/S12e/Gadd45 family protein [Bacillota bacterium LX-D]